MRASLPSVLAMLAGLAMLGGCHADVCQGAFTCVAVHVSGAGISSVDQLTVGASLRGASLGAPRTTPSTPRELTLPLDVAVDFGAGESGPATITIAGLLRGALRASGTATANVVSGRHVSLDLTLSARGAVADLAVAAADLGPVDGAGAGPGDLATVDMKSPPTLTGKQLVAGEFQQLGVSPDGTTITVLSNDADKTLLAFDGVSGAALGLPPVASPTGTMPTDQRSLFYCSRRSTDMSGANQPPDCFTFTAAGHVDSKLLASSSLRVSYDGQSIAFYNPTANGTGTYDVYFGGINGPQAIAGTLPKLPARSWAAPLFFDDATGRFYALMSGQTAGQSDLFMIARGGTAAQATRICTNCGYASVSNDGLCIAAVTAVSGGVGKMAAASTSGAITLTPAGNTPTDAPATGFPYFSSDDKVAYYITASGALAQVDCATNAVTTRVAGGVTAILATGKGWVAYATTALSHGYGDFNLLPDGRAAVAFAGPYAVLASVSPNGNFAVNSVSDPNTGGQSMQLVGSPIGITLTTFSNSGGVFLDDDHMALTTPNGELQLYDVARAHTTLIATHVSETSQSYDESTLFWLVSTPGGAAGDGIYVGRLQ